MELYRLARVRMLLLGVVAAFFLASFSPQHRAYAAEATGADDTPRLERSGCVTDALTEAGAQCYTLDGALRPWVLE